MTNEVAEMVEDYVGLLSFRYTRFTQFGYALFDVS